LIDVVRLGLAWLRAAPIRQAAGLAWRYTAARAISAAGLFIAAAMYGPAAFALFGLYLATLNIGWIVVFLRYESAVVATADAEEARVLLKLCMVIGLVMLAALAPLTLAGVRVGWIPPVYAPLFIIALGARGVLRLALTVATRAGDFRALGRATLVQAVVQPIMLVALTRTSLHGATVMALSDAFGHGVAALVAVLGQGRALASIARQPMAWAELRGGASHWSSLPLLNLPGAVLSVSFATLPLIVVPLLADQDFAGLVALGFRILDIPTQLIGAATTPIFLHRLSAGSGADHRRFAILAITTLAAFIVAAYGTLTFAALVVEPWLARTHWRGLVEVLPLFVGFSAGLALAGPLVEVGGLFREQRVMLMLHGVAFVAGLAAFALGGSAVGWSLAAVSVLAISRAAMLGWFVVSLAGTRRLVPAVT
jgi:hypothetical protein